MYNKILWSGFLATVGIFTVVTSATAQNNVPNPGPSHDSGGYIHDSGGYTIVPTVTTPNISVTQFNPDSGTISGGIINTPIEIGTGSGSGSGSGSGAGLGSRSGTGSGLGTPTIGDSGSETGSGTGNGAISSENAEGERNNASLGKGECATIACLSAKDGTQEITLNDAAELLENSLDTSADNLAAAEREGGREDSIARISRRNTMDESIRHIGRNCHQNRICVNPDVPKVEAKKYETNKSQVSSVLEAREVLERQIAESQKFIDQVNLIDPENNIW